MGDYSEAAIRRMLERGARSAGGACGGDDLMAAYLEGRLAEGERRRFEEHASGCPECLQVMGLAMKLAPAPGESGAAAAGRRAAARKTLFRISIPLTAVAAAAVLVVAGTVVLYMVRDAGRAPVRISEVRTAPLVEPDLPPPAQLARVAAPAAGGGSAPPGAALTGVRDKSHAALEPASTPGAGKAVKAEPPAVMVPREPQEAALSRAQADEASAGEAIVIRALLAQAPGREQAAAPAAGQAVQRMLPEQAENVARGDLRVPGKIAVKGRTFQDRGAYWVDDECAAMPGAEILEVRPDTKEYREIMASYPEIRSLLAGGKSVVLCLNGRIYVLR